MLFGVCLTLASSALAACGSTSDDGGARLAWWNFDTNDNDRIYIEESAGNEVRRLARGRHPDWSSEAGLLAFVDGWSDTDATIYVIGADGSGRRRIVGDAGFPVWSPDGSEIAFLRWVRDDSPDVHVVTVATNRVRRLTYTGRYEWTPVWSASGEQLAGTRPDPDGTTRLVVIDANAVNDVRTVTRPPEGSDDRNPQWSPDGTMLAFDRSIIGEDGRSLSQHVYRVGVDGRGLQRLSRSRGSSGAPAWSPDGGRLAYSTADTDAGIYVTNSDGTDTRRLTREGGAPRWSPDGSKLAFLSARDDPDETFDQLYVMNVDGSGLRRVSHHPQSSDTEFVWVN